MTAMRGAAIEAKSLVKRYVTREGGLFRGRRRVVEALRGVSFQARWGEVLCLLGPNGAGKTTTVKILATLLIPDEGSAYIAGYNVVNEAVEVRKRIGVVLSVEKGFFWKLTGRENLRYFGMLRGLRGRELDERVSHVLRLVGLEQLGAADKLYEDYSLGMKARLALARAILHDPPVLLLDEPTLGLDPMSARRIRDLIRSMAEKGKSIIVTTHNMFEAEIVCDRVAIISKGKIVAEGTPDDLKLKVSGEIPVVARFAAKEAEEATVRNLIYKATSSKAMSIDYRDGVYRVRVLVRAEEAEEAIARLAAILARSGYKILGLEVARPTLEDVFVKIAGEG
jgi:ABC-2 type transport system ATP-binding protein